MAEKNNFYRNFSNRKPFNNVHCTADEELVPVVLNDDVRVTLKQAGLDWDNVESWHFPHSKEVVPVAFVPNKKGHMDTWMKWFNSEVERYLKHNPDSETDERLIHNITKCIRFRGIGSAFDGYGSLVVCVGRGTPGAVLLLYIHTDTAVRSDTVV